MKNSVYARLPSQFARAYHTALKGTIEEITAVAGPTSEVRTMASILVVLLPGCRGANKPVLDDGGDPDDNAGKTEEEREKEKEKEESESEEEIAE